MRFARTMVCNHFPLLRVYQSMRRPIETDFDVFRNRDARAGRAGSPALLPSRSRLAYQAAWNRGSGRAGGRSGARRQVLGLESSNSHPQRLP